MKIIKNFVAYFALFISFAILVLLVLKFMKIIKLSLGDIVVLLFVVLPFCTSLYDKWKPFKLTGNLDIYLKDKFDSYFDGQKSCPSCGKVVKKSELTQDGKCVNCKETN